MELEEMKIKWDAMSLEMDKQKKITDSLIIKMTQVNYKSKINKILMPEAAATVVSFALGSFILVHLQQLNTWYLLASGILALIILLLLPVLSLRAIYKIKAVDIQRNSYKQALLDYTKAKAEFVFVQKLSFYLSCLLLLTGLPVAGKLMAGMDFFKVSRLWIWYALLFPIFYFLASRVYKSYIRSANAAGKILKELEEEA